MAIIKPPPKQPKSLTIQARVEESVTELLLLAIEAAAFLVPCWVPRRYEGIVSVETKECRQHRASQTLSSGQREERILSVGSHLPIHSRRAGEMIRRAFESLGVHRDVTGLN
jgi:hypothetical protein